MLDNADRQMFVVNSERNIDTEAESCKGVSRSEESALRYSCFLRQHVLHQASDIRGTRFIQTDLRAFPEKQAALEKGALTQVPESERGSGYYSTLFLVRKPNVSFRTIINRKLLNHFLKYEKFRMEKIVSYSEPESGQFRGHPGSEGRILSCPNFPGSPKVSQDSSFPREILGEPSISGSSLWSVPSSPGLHQAHGGGDGPCQRTRHCHSTVPGQFSLGVRFQGAPYSAGPQSARNLTEARPRSKPREIPASSFQSMFLPGDCRAFSILLGFYII
ncbi:uncharacterized protein LOC130291946 [Hyla sarda]|uniref:uncharacterized protein LOC130291946 n=1 Tax=Hyla sarda TaxID=327740 RepID=UPI0024C3496A|nr:uncharacterized protein LOC130291946 [Hyla sarda]